MGTSSSELVRALGSLVPPARFERARLETYHADAPGQERAREQALDFTARMQQPASMVERLFGWMGRALPATRPEPPRGLYLVGPAGTGKTHLMAAMYHRLAPDAPCAFIHSSQLFRTAEHPEQLARALAKSGANGRGCRVLMLDEVELDDAANEARLATFLRVLSEEGVALVATSNARPGEFLSRHMSSGGRHRRFLTDALAGRCEIVFVEGEDRRRAIDRERRGCIFVGRPDEAEEALRKAYESDARRSVWVSFEEVRQASTELAHARLIKRILSLESVYVTGVTLQGTDDALRVLRIIDDLYVEPDAPALYFSSTTPPEEWFAAGSHRGVAGGIAEKFERTVSRLREMCETVYVRPRSAVQQVHSQDDS